LHDQFYPLDWEKTLFFLKPLSTILEEEGYPLMNKAELIEALRKETKLPRLKAEQVVEMMFDHMAEALAKGDRVEIRGLCSIFVKEYQGYTGRNPKTAKPIQVAPKKLPLFKCGKELKERVDTHK
jgi:integration host factor subunit beta